MPQRAFVSLVCLTVATILTSCTLTGDPVEVTDPELAQPAADTREPIQGQMACEGRIAFVGRVDGERDVFVVNADGSERFNVTAEMEPGPELTPSWSPDGDRILFARHVGNADLFTIRPDGSGLVRLTERLSREYSPAWSPNGSRVLYGSTSGYATELWVSSADGGETVQLTGSAAYKPDFAWSPDGARIAFTMLDGYNQGDVYVMDAQAQVGAAGNDPANLTQDTANDCCVAWAPDSQRLLFLSSRNDQSGGHLPGIEGTDLLAEGLLASAGAAGVRLDSAQGSDSSTLSAAVRPLTTVEPEQPRDVYLVHRDGSGLTRLTNGAGAEKHASWSPDGTRVLFVSDRDAYDEVFVMAVPGGEAGDGAEPTRLTSSPGDKLHPTWSPDGSCILFVTYDGGESSLSVMDQDGGNLKMLAQGIDTSSGPGWAP